MSDQGTNRHNPQLDDELKHESQGLVQGQGGPGHVEEWRQTVGMPDDTDSTEAAEAFRLDGRLQDAPDTTRGDATGGDAQPPASDAGSSVGPDGDFATADRLAYSTETDDDGTGDGAAGTTTGDGRGLETASQDALGADAVGTDSPGSRPVTPDGTSDTQDVR